MKDDRYSKLDAVQKTLVITVFGAVFFICDVAIAMLITLPFSLINKNWSYWIYTLVALIGAQILLTLLISKFGKRKREREE